MNLTEAKEILCKTGYLLEMSDKKRFILVDKQRNDDYNSEDDYKYVAVFGPASWEHMERFMKRNCTKEISEVPLDPTPSEEPEEGFILITTLL